MNKQPNTFIKLFGLTISLVCLTFMVPVSAQIFSNNANANHITLYADCGFRGEARNVPVGDYQDMRAVQMKNDSLSSIRIPRGLEVTLYQNERFGGFSTSFENDVNCLESGWNDQASSLRVSQGRSTNSSNRNTDNDRSQYTQDKVDGNNVSRIEFSGILLEKNGTQQWQLTNSNGQATQFRELSKNVNALYLESTRNKDNLRVDFFTNDVTILTRNGESASYPLQQALRINDGYQPDRVAPPISNSGRNQNRPGPNANASVTAPRTGQVTGNCFNYKAYSDGGSAGVRFQVGDNAFKRFTKNPVSGRICHSGSVVMEINKTSLATDVTVEIQGVPYKFAANEAHDVLLNTWYRKKITLISR